MTLITIRRTIVLHETRTIYIVSDRPVGPESRHISYIHLKIPSPPKLTKKSFLNSLPPGQQLRYMETSLEATARLMMQWRGPSRLHFPHQSLLAHNTLGQSTNQPMDILVLRSVLHFHGNVVANGRT